MSTLYPNSESFQNAHSKASHRAEVNAVSEVLSDGGILLHSLRRSHWSLPPCPEARPKSYILMTRPNPVQEAVLRLRGVEAVVRTGTDPGTALSGFLQQLLNEVAVA